MNYEQHIFKDIFDDTTSILIKHEHVFFHVFFEIDIRNDVDVHSIIRPIFKCDWVLYTGMPEIIHSYYKNQSASDIIGLALIDFVGPFRMPRIKNISTCYKDVKIPNISIVRISNE